MIYKACVPNKTEGLNLNLFNMITAINELKTLTKHRPYECNCKFDGRKCNSNQMLNTDKCYVSVKNIIQVKKYYIWNPSHVVTNMVNIFQILWMIQ